MSIKVAVVGSRDFTDYEFMRHTLDQQRGDACWTIVSGGARGADALAGRYARERGLPIIVLKPDWKGKGMAAGFLRNTDIVEQADNVIAFWDGQSRGTQDTIAKARRDGKPTIVFPARAPTY